MQAGTSDVGLHEKLFSHWEVGNSADLPISVDDVLVAAKLFQPHRAAGVQLLGGDAHLAAQAKLPPSVKRVEAFQYTAAGSLPPGSAGPPSPSSVTMASEWPVEWAAMWRMASSVPSTTRTARI